MLSPKSVAYKQGRDYHKKEIESYHDLSLGEWYGKLKDKFELGDLEFDSFDNALSSINPTTGESLLASKKNRKNDRAAIDLTITAPKSYSILLSLADAKGDVELKNALLTASDRAVNKTLDHIESDYIFIRVQKNRVKTIEKTGNLLIAKFMHETARPVTNKKTGEVLVDPNHHYHNLTMNFTQCKDGKFRTLEAKKIFKNKKKIGAFYKSELAKNLKDLGLDIQITNKKYIFFKIKGIDKKLEDEFSQRRKQIEEKATELRKKYPNMDEAKLYQKATLESRETKKNITMTREELHKRNIQRAEKYVNVDKLLLSFKEKIKSKTKNIDKTQEETQKEIKEILKAIKEATNAVKRMPKYHQTKYSVLDNSSKKLLGKIRASAIFNQIQIQEVKNQKQLHTMQQVVVNSLEKTRLDTKKLFNCLDNFKCTPKIQKEELIENAKGRVDRDRYIAISSREPSKNARTTELDNRDIRRDATEYRENKEERRAEPQRDDAITARNDRTAHKLSWKEAIAIAERGSTNQHRGVENER